jgi:hypothetical protein
MTRDTHNRRAFTAAGLILIAACGTDVSAANPCDGDEVTCAPLALSAPDTVPVEALAALAPTWIKPLPITSAAVEHNGDWNYVQLTSDRDGQLWLFDRDAAGVRVSLLDDEGVLLDSTLITPPQGLSTPLVSLAVNATWETGSVPSSKLVWTRGAGCDQTVGRAPGCTADYEKVIFDRGLDEAPLRVPLTESLLSDGFVNERGELFYVASRWNEPSSLAKLDRDTRTVLWEQSDFQTLSNEYDLTGTPLANGGTAVMRHSASAYINSIVIHRLDENGVRGETEEFAAQVDRSSYRLLTTGAEPVVLYTDDIGDLHVERLHSDAAQARSVTFLRQEYQMLDLRASAISPAGDVYIFTQSGRRGDEAKPTLCRAPAAGSASCVTLPDAYRSGRDEFSKLTNLVARDGGVVFAQDGTQFLRIDYPE